MELEIGYGMQMKTFYYVCIFSAAVSACLNVASFVFKSLLCFKRFFYECIWRTWDEEEEDDFDYFVRCVEPRLRL